MKYALIFFQENFLDLKGENIFTKPHHKKPSFEIPRISKDTEENRGTNFSRCCKKLYWLANTEKEKSDDDDDNDYMEKFNEPDLKMVMTELFDKR